ncbi:MAG TPA: hypothetical protein VFQ35_23750, partial [Polyangiaceae bacterium]|nr:hypothetical protein [Polyangiaceae bacterium]
DAKQASAARKALGETSRGAYAELARAIDDSVHGRLKNVASRYMAVVEAVRREDHPDAPLIAWFAAQQASIYRHSDPKLFERYRPFLEAALKAPKNIGWRARAELADIYQEGLWELGEADVIEKMARQHGCAQNVRLAGPFGRGAALDTLKGYAPERPGPWPVSFEPEPGSGEPPRVLETERDGCYVSAKEASGPGIYYVETYFDVTQPTDVLIAVQGAYAIRVDDHEVLRRDLREWGSWPRFGVAVRLTAGRHRVVARVAEAQSSIRLLHVDGSALDVPTSADASLPYQLARPQVLPEANVLDRYLVRGTYRDPGQDLLRYLAAMMANVEGQADVANVLLEPLLAAPDRAAGASLAVSALFTDNDPIFSDSQRQDLSRELRERAVARDPKLWHPRLLLAVGRADREGRVEAAREVKKLVAEFPEVPAVSSELMRLYSELGWKVEFAQSALDLAARFPDEPDALSAAVEVLEAQGRSAEADKLVERIQKLDPDQEIRLRRALDRLDFPTALAELKRLAARRPKRKDLPERIYDVLVRAGNPGEVLKKLELALEQEPKNEKARLDLADVHYALGKHDALVKALVEAVTRGAPSARLEEAIDLVEGISELEPYRHDARKVIAEYERSGQQLEGTAARVLDYAAVWVHSDGSSRMLEHEIIKIQSAEAIADQAEQPLQQGVLLHMRVIKADGRTLEPELVEGKPTL